MSACHAMHMLCMFIPSLVSEHGREFILIYVSDDVAHTGVGRLPTQPTASEQPVTQRRAGLKRSARNIEPGDYDENGNSEEGPTMQAHAGGGANKRAKTVLGARDINAHQVLQYVHTSPNTPHALHHTPFSRLPPPDASPMQSNTPPCSPHAGACPCKTLLRALSLPAHLRSPVSLCQTGARPLRRVSPALRRTTPSWTSVACWCARASRGWRGS